jgi:acetyl-CoA acetyltransferase
MIGRAKSSNKVAIIGFAQSMVTRNADVSLGAMTVSTARDAIADAGLKVADIDGFVTASLFPTAGAHAAVDGISLVSSNWLAKHLGVNPTYAAGFQGVGQLPGAVALAVNAVVSGAADYVLMHRSLHNPHGTYHANPLKEAHGDQQWTVPQGYFGPLAMIALPYREYLNRYGASREAMARVVVEARKNGARIPWSYWSNKPLTAEEYLSEPMISDPVGRLDCDIPVDGVACFIFTSAERCLDHPHQPVYVAGHAAGTPAKHRLPMHWPLDDIMEVGMETGRRLWERSGIRSTDVDLPQVYDGFSPLVYFWLESLSLCQVGEAHQVVLDGGIDSDRNGGLPVLSGGGALGNGRMHGVPQMLECYLQLSGRAGVRQRKHVSIGVACHSSPHYGGAVAYATNAF